MCWDECSNLLKWSLLNCASAHKLSSISQLSPLTLVPHPLNALLFCSFCHFGEDVSAKIWAFIIFIVESYVFPLSSLSNAGFAFMWAEQKLFSPRTKKLHPEHFCHHQLFSMWALSERGEKKNSGIINGRKKTQIQRSESWSGVILSLYFKFKKHFFIAPGVNYWGAQVERFYVLMLMVKYFSALHLNISAAALSALVTLLAVKTAFEDFMAYTLLMEINY